MRLLHPENIEDLAIGAAVLGTGGGGDPYVGKLMAIQSIREYGPVTLLDLDEIGDDDLIVPSAMMGAPTVMVEKLPSGEEIVKAFQALESFLGKPIKATMSIEAGGLNSTTPFTVAATLGIPMVDADGMGRAFPELQMVTFTIYDIPATPMAIADEKGNSAILNTMSNRWTETFARSLTIDMGSSAMIALYPLTGKQLKAAGVAGTITMAEQIGRAIRESRAADHDPIGTVLRVTNGYRLFEGKIVDVARRTETGFARGDATLEGTGSMAGSTMKISFQNEHLIAIKDGAVCASVPDLITMLDAETGDPITTEGMRYGFRVVVVGMPCDPKWRTPKGLEIVGPRYFGYDIDYVPIEQRYGALTR
ncbi:MAG: DUF917 domain-containing protein [Chloroflexaceae bacterium]|nr:DUF917 domain-containing protein [Chloroflexaceae bacterium]NJL34052.1 DUF917 domain-containing protein [Chloroflexaceae bacterium]NJO05368.1 DUF917 domain-containing protein [Chloroflexaceae bacterium]